MRLLRPLTRLRSGLPRRLPSGTVVLGTLCAIGVLGGVGAVAHARSATHYALDPLRNCIALRGGLVSFQAGGAATEGTASVDVHGDIAVIAFGKDGREAGQLAGAFDGSTRHANLVIRPGTAAAAAGRAAGAQAVSTIERCLSDGKGRPKQAPAGYAYGAAALASFQQACDRAKASSAQCRCVLTGAQARMPLSDFLRVAEATEVADEAKMTELLDGCRLVG
jgi:hypothetical protein